MQPPVTLRAIQEAREALAGVARLTPVWPSLSLEEETGAPVLLKCEQMQRSGSFKVRGALNFVHHLAADERQRGIVAASAGNHAQGIALAGGRRGISVLVVMPQTTPLSKVSATRRYGAEVVLHGSSLAEAQNHALELAASSGAVYASPFDDDAVIAGQGTVGLEILEQVPDVAEILVPAGGGGLLGGIACAVKSLRPDVRVIGVQSAAMDGIVRSRALGEPVSTAARRTVADGVAVPGPSARTYALVQRYVDDVVSCTEEQIVHALLFLIEGSRMVVEGAGALGVAALQSHRYRPAGKTVVVVSGGNIDINMIGLVVRQGLAEAGRYRRLHVEITDVPGQLARIADAIGMARGNILYVNHNREAPLTNFGGAIVELLIEVNDSQHFAAVRAAVEGAGFDLVEPGL